MNIYLRRLLSDDQGTLGRITGPGFEFFTLELPWRNNAPKISCIPAGEYHCVWTASPRMHKSTYEVTHVHGRGGIRIHSGNLAGDPSVYVSHSLGCPLIGNRLGAIRGQRAVLDSRSAIARFERILARRPFTLVIEGDQHA